MKNAYRSMNFIKTWDNIVVNETLKSFSSMFKTKFEVN